MYYIFCVCAFIIFLCSNRICTLIQVKIYSTWPLFVAMWKRLCGFLISIETMPTLLLTVSPYCLLQTPLVSPILYTICYVSTRYFFVVCYKIDIICRTRYSLSESEIPLFIWLPRNELHFALCSGPFFDIRGDNYFGGYPLHFAACSNSTEIFDLILNYASSTRYVAHFCVYSMSLNYTNISIYGFVESIHTYMRTVKPSIINLNLWHSNTTLEWTHTHSDWVTLL